MNVPTKDQKQGRRFGWRLRCVEAPAGVPLCLLLHTNRVSKFRRRVTLPVNELSNIVKMKCPLYELFSEYCMNKIKQMQDRHFFDLVCQLWSQNQLVTRHWLPLVVLQAARFRHVVPVWGPPILAELEFWCHIRYVSTQTHAHTHTNTLSFSWLIFSSVSFLVFLNYRYFFRNHNHFPSLPHPRSICGAPCKVSTTFCHYARRSLPDTPVKNTKNHEIHLFHFISFHFISFHFISFIHSFFSFLFVSFPFFSFRFLSSPFLSFPFLCFRFISFISFRFISFRFISFHFVSFHFVSFHVISFHFLSFHFISFFHSFILSFISFHFISFIHGRATRDPWLLCGTQAQSTLARRTTALFHAVLQPITVWRRTCVRSAHPFASWRTNCAETNTYLVQTRHDNAGLQHKQVRTFIQVFFKKAINGFGWFETIQIQSSWDNSDMGQSDAWTLANSSLSKQFPIWNKVNALERMRCFFKDRALKLCLNAAI